MTKRVRDVWHILQLLREVWMKVGLKKLESHEGITVKTLLNSRVTGLFMDIAFAKEKGFKMEKLKKPLLQNVDRTANVEGAITHQVEYNMFFKGHVEKVTMNVYNLGKTEIILDILWLTAHNLEIDWEKGEVKIMQCLPICGKRKQKVKEKEIKKAKNDKDKKVLKKLVSKKFQRQKKVFGKKELERMLVQKTWDHAIELKKGFTPKKGKVYSLSREKREKVQVFVEDQLRKEYI